MSALETAWNKYLETAAAARRENPKLDGREFWQPTKAILAKLDTIEPKWGWTPTTSPEVCTQIMSQHEVRDGVMDEVVHFEMQKVRLPLGPLTFRTLFQLALNCGQLLGSDEKASVMSNSLSSYVGLATLEDMDKVWRKIQPW